MPPDNEYAHIDLSYSSSSSEFIYRKTSNRTLAFQDKLPKLPIPSLEDTCNRYLRALEALQDEKDHANTKAAVKHFLETDGPVLHDMLKEYAKDKARFVLLSHMSRLFTDCPIQLHRGILVCYFHINRKLSILISCRYESYLSHSDPVVLALNPYFVLEYVVIFTTSVI